MLEAIRKAFDFFVHMLLNEPQYDILDVRGGVEISDCCLFPYTGKPMAKFTTISLYIFFLL